ncbi:MAG: hypothetical protein IJZ82_06895 [Lachnospiraceae bacterium]|nr:hypothetical protein [Lachnospiraceae bacterium]
MIIKFDHISFSCRIGEEGACRLPEGYFFDFAEEGLPNIGAKDTLLQEKQAVHNIRMYRAEESYPIEITSYPQCEGENQKFLLSAEEIVVVTQNVEETMEFYEAMGFQRGENNVLALLPFMDKRKVVLKIKEGDPGKVFLDKNGMGSLAFVVDRIEKQKQQLEKRGFWVSDIEKLLVNGKALKICFCANAQGDIVEFIGVR